MTELLSRRGYLGIFICVFIGNLGVSVPEELVILAAGFLAERHTLQIGPVYMISPSGSAACSASFRAIARTPSILWRCSKLREACHAIPVEMS
jgi:hypothetical protein